MHAYVPTYICTYAYAYIHTYMLCHYIHRYICTRRYICFQTMCDLRKAWFLTKHELGSFSKLLLLQCSKKCSATKVIITKKTTNTKYMHVVYILSHTHNICFLQRPNFMACLLFQHLQQLPNTLKGYIVLLTTPIHFIDGKYHIKQLKSETS